MKPHEYVRATAEIMGRPMSDAAAAVMTSKLSAYPRPDVVHALDRCASECHALRLVDVLDRLPNGHPGLEEAWAICSPALTSEDATIVWTDEIAEAFGAARNLSHDHVAARMAFREAYQRIRGDAGTTLPKWQVSLGHDPTMRAAAVLRSVELGRLPAGDVERLLPPGTPKPKPRLTGTPTRLFGSGDNDGS